MNGLDDSMEKVLKPNPHLLLLQALDIKLSILQWVKSQVVTAGPVPCSGSNISMEGGFSNYNKSEFSCHRRRRCEIYWTNMTQPPPIYFPSLYDRSVSTSPVNNFNIWKNLGVPSKDQTQPQCLTNEKAPWPPGLADISYEPLWFFNTPFKGDYAPRPSHLDEICELEIQIKEMELLTITGDGFDYEKYHFLKAVKDKKMQNIKAELEFSKQKAAS